MALDSVVFSSGTKFYQELASRYIRHTKGLFILAPSGAGKTHFCKAQIESHWIDGDLLWVESGAQPDPADKYWTMGAEVIHQVEQRSDVITTEAKHQGYWVMGASCYWLRPDAVVIPNWDTQLKYIKHRQEHDYDGGATTDALDQLKSHMAEIKKWHTDHNVPLFETLEEAVDSLTKSVGRLA